MKQAVLGLVAIGIMVVIAAIYLQYTVTHAGYGFTSP